MARPRTTVFIATSVDGFIARPDDGIDFLDAVDPVEDPAEDFGWRGFWPTVDALVMGRRTYDTVLGFDQWMYDDTPVYVLTSHPDDVVAIAGGDVRPITGEPAQVLDAIGAAGAAHVYVDGGVTIQGFVRERLIDRFVLTTIPVLIGEGIPLFGPTVGDVHLELEATRTWPNGMVQRTYVPREAPGTTPG